jgi:hypothetical protein
MIIALVLQPGCVNMSGFPNAKKDDVYARMSAAYDQVDEEANMFYIDDDDLTPVGRHPHDSIFGHAPIWQRSNLFKIDEKDAVRR